MASSLFKTLAKRTGLTETQVRQLWPRAIRSAGSIPDKKGRPVANVPLAVQHLRSFARTEATKQRYRAQRTRILAREGTNRDMLKLTDGTESQDVMNFILLF